VCCVWEPISVVETRGRPWGWFSLMGRWGASEECDAGVCLTEGRGGEERCGLHDKEIVVRPVNVGLDGV